MEKILKWSIQAQDPSTENQAPKPDEKALQELFFGGVDEATQMKDAVAAAINTELTVENREIALDNLEMLIENLDNANNLENCGLWQPILSLLDDSEATVRKMACWVTGTATQNNPKSQEALVKHEAAIPKLLKLVLEDEDKEVRLKAIYALTSVIGHNPKGYEQFDKADGWLTVKKLCETTDYSKMRMRVLTLLHVISAVEPVDEKNEAIRKHSIVGELLNIMAQSDHVDSEEKALYVVSSLHTNGFKFTGAEINNIGELRQGIIDKSSGGVHPDDVPFSQ